MAGISFSSIREALAQQTSEFFRLEHTQGRYETGDPVSFYAKSDLEDPDLSFDVSNNMALANCGKNGILRSLVFYHGNALVDSSFPGMWVKKLFTSEGPFTFRVRFGDTVHQIGQTDWPYKTSMLGNVFPMTQYDCGFARLTVITFAPVSADGSVRLRGVVHGMLVENTSGTALQGSVLAPAAESKVTFHLDDEITHIRFAECESTARESVTMPSTGLDKNPEGRTVQLQAAGFSLQPGESFWAPAVIAAYGEPVHTAVEEKGTLYWLNQTWSYFKGITGTLAMPEDPFAAEFFERTVHQCIECTGMDRLGRHAGSDLGTGPTTEVICMKDLYYSYLPLSLLEPAFFREGLLWFLHRSVRPAGNKFGDGGVTHSLSNALTPVLMAGLYYESTGDCAFFLNHTDLKDTLDGNLRQVLATRRGEDVWMFPSRFISDGPSLGDWHTGSNVCAWLAFRTFARILDEVYGEAEKAREYRSVAGRINDSIETRTVVDGPFGRQYNEGINQDGSVPVFGHEGEENDTTLMPFYGYKSYDDISYKNYMRFSVSEHNRFYTPRLKGVKFAVEEDAITEATCPGYVTGFANVADRDSMSGPDGYLTEIRRHTDVDGSMWWWPYYRKGTYGQVIRINHDIPLYPGKCGWGSGVFVCLFITEILGVRYDAPKRELRFRPFSPSSGFSWEGFRAGSGVFSVGLTRHEDKTVAKATNHNEFSVTVQLEIPLEPGCTGRSLRINGEEVPFTTGQFLDRVTVKAEVRLAQGESLEAVVALGNALTP